MHAPASTLALALALVSASCAETASPAGGGTAILVAGTYTGSRTWVENACGPNTPLNPLTIVVAHTRGATSATINDGTATFPGALMADGSYAITPISATLANGVPFQMTIAGRFGRTSLELRQTVTENRSSGACRYVIDWVTTKSGTPNDIP